MFWLFLFVVVVWAVTHFYLRGEDLAPYDTPRPELFADHPEGSEAHREAIERLGGMSEVTVGVPRNKRLHLLRDYMDQMGDDVEFDGEIVAVNQDGIRGEWLVPRVCDPQHRLLYIHGGAFVMGSPRSHRAITCQYAQLLGGPVFSLDYSLMPERRRQQGIDDCCRAYRWILDNGPEGATPLKDLYVSGDSAGGNLSLMVSAWVRDQGLRAPNGVIALSPATDGTLSSPSWTTNLATDHMLGPEFGKFSKIPLWLIAWVSLFNARKTPAHPSVSPVYGDLSGLPPTLLHVSSAEMLYDDSVRYVNKARASGSPVSVQVWPHMLHVWHIFERDMPEAKEAFAEIARFMEEHRSQPAQWEAA